MRKLLRLRKDNDSIRLGDIRFIEDEDNVIYYQRQLGNQTFGFCCNLANTAYKCRVPKTSEILSQISEHCTIDIENGCTQLTIDPGGFAVISI